MLVKQFEPDRQRLTGAAVMNYHACQPRDSIQLKKN